MNKKETIKSIQKEIDCINKRIDEKIVRGLPYKTEARRHKILLSQLSKSTNNAEIGIFSKLEFLSAIFF